MAIQSISPWGPAAKPSSDVCMNKISFLTSSLL
jgi:hypothetical protein